MAVDYVRPINLVALDIGTMKYVVPVSSRSSTFDMHALFVPP